MELRDIVVYFKDGTTSRNHIDSSIYGYSITSEYVTLNHFADEPPYDLHLLQEIYETQWKGKEISKVAIEDGESEYILKNINHTDYTIVYESASTMARETVKFSH